MPEDFSFKRSPRGSNIEPRRDSRPKVGLFPQRLMCRTGARSGCEVEESGDGPREFRGGCRTGRVHDYDEIGVCRNDEGVAMRSEPMCPVRLLRYHRDNSGKGPLDCSCLHTQRSRYRPRRQEQH